MSKYAFIKDTNIVPVHKTLKLTYEEDYSGESKTLEVNIYPYTVEEKLYIKNVSEEATVLLKSENKEDVEAGNKKSEENLYHSSLVILKKDDKDITLDIIKKMPVTWLNEIIMSALEFEGIDRKELEKLAEKKEENKL